MFSTKRTVTSVKQHFYSQVSKSKSTCLENCSSTSKRVGLIKKYLISHKNYKDFVYVPMASPKNLLSTPPGGLCKYFHQSL